MQTAVAQMNAQTILRLCVNLWMFFCLRKPDAGYIATASSETDLGGQASRTFVTDAGAFHGAAPHERDETLVA